MVSKSPIPGVVGPLPFMAFPWLIPTSHQGIHVTWHDHPRPPRRLVCRTSVPCIDRSWSKFCRRRNWVFQQLKWGSLRSQIERIDIIYIYKHIKGSGKDVWSVFMCFSRTARWCENWVRSWFGWKIFRWDWSSPWMAREIPCRFGAYLKWPKWSRFFQKHLHPNVASNALERGFVSIFWGSRCERRPADAARCFCFGFLGTVSSRMFVSAPDYIIPLCKYLTST